MADKAVPVETRLLVGLLSERSQINVSGLCREVTISRSSFYRQKARALAEGPVAASVPRSRRPLSSPGQTSAEVEDAIVALRKELKDAGLDCGARTIAFHLKRLRGTSPAVSTVHAILLRRGLVTPSPGKRPKSADKRFVYPRPNDCWQIDGMCWWLADGTKVTVLQVLDDHSRKIMASLAAPSEDGESAWAVLTKGFAVNGLPSKVLSDNSLAFNGTRRGKVVDVERNLRALGIRPSTSRPRHPQTCGKNERSHQTLQLWLNAHPAPATLSGLQALLDDYDHIYNDTRPHQGLDMATPSDVWAATDRSGPAHSPVPHPTKISTAKVASNGAVSVGARQTLSVGRHHAGQTVTVIRTGDDTAIFQGAKLLRDAVLTPGQHPYTSRTNPP